MKVFNRVRRGVKAFRTAFEETVKVYPDLSGLTKDEFLDAIKSTHRNLWEKVLAPPYTANQLK
ncbi:hypothetical protein SAMN04487995_4514 [Dyadobacter koreensis]|uniref:Uncharacterized protein n=1 Tax=Dyadobacter koreensis TaxID=408657 RepID=A0A1H6YH27_9BACT|nr:hypothetical protein SAMN04487995_4514 [Dyadobacter koreensis]